MNLPIVLPTLPDIQSDILDDLKGKLSLFPAFFEQDWFKNPHTMPTFVPPCEKSEFLELEYVGEYDDGKCCGDVYRMEDGSFIMKTDFGMSIWFKLEGEQPKRDRVENLTTTMFIFDTIEKVWEEAHDVVNDKRHGSLVHWHPSGKIDTIGTTYNDETVIELEYTEEGIVSHFDTDVRNCYLDSSTSDLRFRAFFDKRFPNIDMEMSVCHNGISHIIFSMNGVVSWIETVLTNAENIVDNVSPFIWNMYCYSDYVEVRKFGHLTDIENPCTVDELYGTLESDGCKCLDIVEVYDVKTGKQASIRKPSLGLVLIYRSERIAWIETVTQFQRMMW